MTDYFLPPARVWLAIVAVGLTVWGCGSSGRGLSSSPPLDSFAAVPLDSFRGKTSRLGEPSGIAVDFAGRVLVADGSPGRLVRWARADGTEQEFQRPADARFNPSGVAISGFFVYAVDEPSRRILRFDDQGAYRDVLLNFETSERGRRVSPYGLAVDPSGRIAVTDVENHQVLVYDSYLTLEFAFGNFGSYEGQLSSPRGISFAPSGDIVVADTGNRRIQIFSDGGALRRIVPASGAENPLRRPRRAVADESGVVYVADPGAGAVFVFAADGTLVRPVVVEGTPAFSPSDVARSRQGLLFVADGASRSVLVFEGF